MSQPQPEHADYIEFIPAAATSSPVALVGLDREPEAAGLAIQLQQAIAEAQAAGQARDAALQQLARAEQQLATMRDTETNLRSQFVEVTSLIQERDAAMAESDRHSRELTEAARKLENALRERQEAQRQRDEARQQAENFHRTHGDPGKIAAETQKQLNAIRQARDGAHAQLLEMQSKLTHTEDQIADLEDQREISTEANRRSEAESADYRRRLEATTLDRDATAQQVEELTRELEEQRSESSGLSAEQTAARQENGAQLTALRQETETLRQEVEMLDAQYQSVAGERDGSLASLQAAQEQIGQIFRERDSLRGLAGGAVTLEAQLVELCNHVAVLEATGESARSGQEHLAVLQDRFEKQRLETIDLATRLQTAQREIRELSATLAEARLQVKFAAAAARPAKVAAPGAVHDHALPPEPAPATAVTTLAEGMADTLTEKDARSAHGAMRQCFHSFTKTPDDLSLLNELFCHVQGFSERTRAAGHFAVHRVLTTFSELTRSLYETPEQINSSTLRTVQQTIEFLGVLLRNRSFAQMRDPAKAQIFAVDDDAENGAAIQMAMETAGMRTTCAQEPAAALTELARYRYDLILLDVRLPGTDGFELCRQIRELPLNHATPIIFVTGMATPENREQSILSGGCDFITKPFNIHELCLKAMTFILKTQLPAA